MVELEHIALELAEVKAMLKQLMDTAPKPVPPLVSLNDAAQALVVDNRTAKAKQQALYHLINTGHYREDHEVFKRGGRWLFDVQACQKRDRTPARKR